jgi:hypothetical protein
MYLNWSENQVVNLGDVGSSPIICAMAYKHDADKKAAASRHYQANKQDYLDRRARIREKLRNKLRETKNVPCMDCGVRYPYYVMDLDHRPGEVKMYNPATMVNLGSVVKLEREIAKCDVVCSNCHRQRTFDRKEA